MPISDTNSSDLSPLDKLIDLTTKLKALSLEAFFVNDANKVIVTHKYIETVVNDYAQQTQNSAMFNKWLQIDTKFEKALKEYKSELLMMFTGLQSLGQAQNVMEQPIVNTPQQSPQPGQLPVDKGL